MLLHLVVHICSCFFLFSFSSSGGDNASPVSGWSAVCSVIIFNVAHVQSYCTAWQSTSTLGIDFQRSFMLEPWISALQGGGAHAEALGSSCGRSCDTTSPDTVSLVRMHHRQDPGSSVFEQALERVDTGGGRGRTFLQRHQWRELRLALGVGEDHSSYSHVS